MQKRKSNMNAELDHLKSIRVKFIKHMQAYKSGKANVWPCSLRERYVSFLQYVYLTLCD